MEMMTPGGYVSLTPEKARTLLQGESAEGHPGDPEHAMKIDAEALLAQTVHSANFHAGAWRLLTDYAQKESKEDKRMERSEIMERLREKLDRGIQAMQREWFALSPSLVAGKAQEIEASRIAYNELCDGRTYSDETLEYLLRFENPLKVVRDKWIEEQCLPDAGEEMNRVLRSVMNDREAGWEYELDREYMPERDDGMKLC